MTDLNCGDETVAERSSVDSKGGSLYHNPHHNNNHNHQTPSVIVQLPNFYNLKTNKTKFTPAYDSNSEEDSLGKPPHDILSDSHSDKALDHHDGSRSEILDSTKLLLCYSTNSYNAGSGGGKGGPQFRFSSLPETEEMDRSLMHMMVDGSGSEIFKDDDVLKASDKDESFPSRLGVGKNDGEPEKGEMHQIVDGKVVGVGQQHVELSFNFSRTDHSMDNDDDDDRVLKQRRGLVHFTDETDRRLLDSELVHSDSNRQRHVLVSGQNSNYIETSRSSEYATLTPLLLPLPPISNLIRRELPSGVASSIHNSNKPKHVAGDHEDYNNGIEDQQRGLMESANGGGIDNTGVNGPESAEDKSKSDGDASPFFSFQTHGNNNHNSLTADDHGLMLANSDQYHSRYIDITLPEMENSDMGSRVITSYINTSPSHTPLNSGSAGQLNFFYDATNNFQAQHEINENIIGQDTSITGHRNTPKLSPTGGQCPKGVLTNGLILLNQAQASEDLILDGIDSDFGSTKVVFKSNNMGGHRIRMGDDAILSSSLHGGGRIVHNSYDQKSGGLEKKGCDYYASKYSNHENPFQDEGDNGGGQNNNNNNTHQKDAFHNGILGENKHKPQEYLVNEVVAHSSHHKYQSRKRENSDGNRSPGVSMSSLENEEINTKELAQKISAELKRYSIPQAIFAQRVLCRSQVKVHLVG